MRQALGTLLVLASAVGFGVMPWFDHWVSGGGAGVFSMLAIRFGIGALILVVIAWRLGYRAPRGGLLLGLVLLGAVGYFLEALLYFTALRNGPKGMAALLLYLHPGLVTLIAWAVFRDRPGRGALAALAIATAGMLLTIGSVRGTTTVGLACGLASAAVYAVYIVAGSRLAPRAGAIPSSVVVTASACVAFTAAALVTGDAMPATLAAWAGIAGLGVVSTAGSIVCLFAGMAIIGPVRASTISIAEPAVAVAVGAAFLGDDFTPVQALGGAMILAAAVLTAWSRPAPVRDFERAAGGGPGSGGSTS